MERGDSVRIPVIRLPIVYKGRTLEQFYKADFVCYDKIIVELKAISQLIRRAPPPSVFNYLRATRHEDSASSVNFGASPELEHESYRTYVTVFFV